MEEVTAGTVHSPEGAYTEYLNALREWNTEILRALKIAQLNRLEKECGKQLPRRALIDLRAGRSMPHRKTKELISELLEKLGSL